MYIICNRWHKGKNIKDAKIGVGNKKEKEKAFKKQRRVKINNVFKSILPWKV